MTPEGQQKDQQKQQEIQRLNALARVFGSAGNVLLMGGCCLPVAIVIALILMAMAGLFK